MNILLSSRSDLFLIHIPNPGVATSGQLPLGKTMSQTITSYRTLACELGFLLPITSWFHEPLPIIVLIDKLQLTQGGQDQVNLGHSYDAS